MRRITMWLMATVSAVALLFSYHTSTSGPTTPTGGTTGTVFTSAPEAGASADTSTKRGAGAAGGAGSGGPAPRAPRTATGAVADTQWGPVQVQLTVTGHTITKVSVLQHPSGNSTSDQINSYALPILVRDTMDTQGRGVHMVSGATYTSSGYLQSLQSALDQAGL